MRKVTTSTLSVVASVVLAVLTLGVFSIARDKGPASTVVRYLEAVARQDINAQADLTLQPADHPSTQNLRRMLTEALSVGDGAGVQVKSQRGREALVMVTIKYRQGFFSLAFHLTKPRYSWKIDAQSMMAPTPASPY
ncbi:MAG: hypothetical protein KIT11_06880 [Fimbriimonadaceae bacterium]|nr:hypothetical protein [Fimbriimonadaceae bacterium]QYK56076.1 MAG: hypothetical protein KF733_01070 [Fimbriimonadaceae bacterium]